MFLKHSMLNLGKSNKISLLLWIACLHEAASVKTGDLNADVRRYIVNDEIEQICKTEISCFYILLLFG